MTEESKSFQLNGLEARIFHASRRENSLKACKEAGFYPAFMPQLARIRIGADEDSALWNYWCDSNSLCATGITNRGSRVAVYVHRPHYFSDPETIERTIQRDWEHFMMMPQGVVRDIDFAGTVPEEELQKLVDSDGELDKQGNRVVWVVDYDKIREFPNFCGLCIEEVLEHPITIPYFGDRGIATEYLSKHRDVFGNRIGVGYLPTEMRGPPYGSFYGPNLGHILWLGGRNEGNLTPGGLYEGRICGEGNLVGLSNNDR